MREIDQQQEITSANKGAKFTEKESARNQVKEPLSQRDPLRTVLSKRRNKSNASTLSKKISEPSTSNRLSRLSRFRQKSMAYLPNRDIESYGQSIISSPRLSYVRY